MLGATLTSMYAMRPTEPALRPFVESCWYFTSALPAGRERVLPVGGMQLLVNLFEDELRTYAGDRVVQRTPGAALQGAYRGPVVIDTEQQRAIVGVTFRPGGAYPFFPAPASATSDRLVPLDQLWGRDGAVLRDRLLSAGRPGHVLRCLEAALLSRVSRSPSPDPALRYAVAAFDRGARVGAVADRLGMTHRRFGRRFTDQVGLSPKRFARVRRFQRTLAAIGPRSQVDWALLAAEHGFYDQSHLIHEFQALAGISPTGYRPRTPSERNHIPLAG